MTAELQRRNRLVGDACKHWERFIKAMQEVAAEDPIWALIVASGMNGDMQAMILPDLVAELRRAGHSWQVIGDALGCSRSAAHQKYRHLEDDDQADPAA